MYINLMCSQTCQPVVICNAKDAVFKVDCERYTIKAAVTRQASEAARMV